MHHIFCTIVLQLFLLAPDVFGVPYTPRCKNKGYCTLPPTGYSLDHAPPLHSVRRRTRRSFRLCRTRRTGLIRHYTLSESDLAVISQHRGGANRLGFAVQLCYMRYPGVMLGADEAPFPPLLKLVASADQSASRMLG